MIKIIPETYKEEGTAEWSQVELSQLHLVKKMSGAASKLSIATLTIINQIQKENLLKF